MFQRCQLTLCFVFCFLLIQPFTGFAVEEFRVSKYGSGEQIWFEAEAFDERDSADVYKLGKGEGALVRRKGRLGISSPTPVDKVGYSTGSTSVLLMEKQGTGGLSCAPLIRAIIQIGCGFWETMAMKFQRTNPPLFVLITSSLKKTFPNGHGCGQVISERMVARSTNYKTVKTS